MAYIKKYIFLIIVVIALAQYTSAFPRDIRVANIEDVSKIPDLTKKVTDIPNYKDSFGIPGRVICPFEEPTEHISCQEHCLPKGYSYGVCVSGTCSCI